MGYLKFSETDFQKAAATFRKSLLQLPLTQLDEILPYVTVRPGVTYNEMVGEASVNAELAPYSKGRRTNTDLNLKIRELKTYFGSVNADFEPNRYIQTLLGHHAMQAMGEEQIQTPQAQEVLGMVAKQVGHSLNNAVFSATRNESGTTTSALFDGWDTITATEIAAGNIAAAKKNLVELSAAITSANAVDTIKEVMYNMDVELRKQDCFLFVPYEVADAYNENYMLTHSGLIYNQQYNQVTVEGSNNRLTIVPLVSKAGSKFLHIAPKANMLIGVDQLSDQETVRVKEYAPDELTFMMRMFFGVQFESIDPRRLMTVKLYEAPAQQDPGEDGEEH